MFDYKISKHPHFDEACRAFALRHNMAKLAERAGMNVQTLRNKLNPDQPHQLTAPEIWLLTDLTEDSTLVDDAEWTITTLTHTVSPDNGFTTSIELEVKIDDLEIE